MVPSPKDPAEEVSCTQSHPFLSCRRWCCHQHRFSQTQLRVQSHPLTAAAGWGERKILRQICHHTFATWGYKLSCSAVQTHAALEPYSVDIHTWQANSRWVLLDSSLFGLMLQWQQALQCSHWAFILEHKYIVGSTPILLKHKISSFSSHIQWKVLALSTGFGLHFYLVWTTNSLGFTHYTRDGPIKCVMPNSLSTVKWNYEGIKQKN